MKNPMRNRAALSTLLLLLLLGFSSIGAAATTQCPSQYLNGVAPDIVNQKLAVKTRELCYDNFAVMHSGVSRTPLWSAEHLTGQNIFDGKHIKRPNKFHPEAQLPKSERSELNDYAHSGFDRGHMAPNGDMPTAEAKDQCFTLANMVPQNHINNTQLWEHIEGTVRKLATQEGEL